MFILVTVASEAFLISISFLNRVPVNGSESHVRGCRKYCFTEKEWGIFSEEIQFLNDCLCLHLEERKLLFLMAV